MHQRFSNGGLQSTGGSWPKVQWLMTQCSMVHLQSLSGTLQEATSRLHRAHDRTPLPPMAPRSDFQLTSGLHLWLPVASWKCSGACGCPWSGMPMIWARPLGVLSKAFQVKHWTLGHDPPWRTRWLTTDLHPFVFWLWPKGEQPGFLFISNSECTPDT